MMGEGKESVFGVLLRASERLAYKLSGAEIVKEKAGVVVQLTESVEEALMGAGEVLYLLVERWADDNVEVSREDFGDGDDREKDGSVASALADVNEERKEMDSREKKGYQFYSEYMVLNQPSEELAQEFSAASSELRETLANILTEDRLHLFFLDIWEDSEVTTDMVGGTVFGDLIAFEDALIEGQVAGEADIEAMFRWRVRELRDYLDTPALVGKDVKSLREAVIELDKFQVKMHGQQLMQHTGFADILKFEGSSLTQRISDVGGAFETVLGGNIKQEARPPAIDVMKEIFESIRNMPGLERLEKKGPEIS